MPYVVGEKGPELFMPQMNGMIISNDKLSTALSSRNTIGGATAFAQQQAPQYIPVMVPVVSKNETNFHGDINATDMDAVVKYAERKKRSTSLTGV